jgi:hypothetical protein
VNILYKEAFSVIENTQWTDSGFVTHQSKKGADYEDVEIHSGDDALCGYGHCFWRHRVRR